MKVVACSAVSSDLCSLRNAFSCAPEGEKLLKEGSFKYLSPEIYEVYDDPETHDIRKHVLAGAALTNKPYFKELEPVYAFSEPDITKQIIDRMDLKKISRNNFPNSRRPLDGAVEAEVQRRRWLL